MEKMELLAYAKINLTLDVTGRLPNGYHRIDSFMQSVSLADKLTVEIKQGSGIEVGCRSSYAPDGKDNIVYRAVQRYLQETGHNANVKITLEKNIPSPMGLGGGSADAAAVLRALADYFGEASDSPSLIRVAAAIGSDVPFCLHGGTQRVRGMGEQLTPLPALPDCLFVIAYGKKPTLTGPAYQLLDQMFGNFAEPTPTEHADARRMETALAQGALSEVGAALYNIFENLFSETAEPPVLKERLKQAGALGSLMSGSGSSVYGIFSPQERALAERAVARLKEEGFGAVLCHPVPRLTKNSTETIHCF